MIGKDIGTPENELCDVGENDNASVRAFPPITLSEMGHTALFYSELEEAGGPLI